MGAHELLEGRHLVALLPVGAVDNDVGTVREAVGAQRVAPLRSPTPRPQGEHGERQREAQDSGQTIPLSKPRMAATASAVPKPAMATPGRSAPSSNSVAEDVRHTVMIHAMGAV